MTRETTQQQAASVWAKSDPFVEGTTGELDPYLTGESTRRDVPVSFDPEHRQYGWRTVQHGIIPVPLERRDDEQTDGPDTDTALTHEPMAALE